MRIAVTRGFSRNFFRATAVVENRRKSAWQFTQFVAVSGDDALQREQVCKAGLLEILSYFTPGG
jgi:hypothetical protein